MKFFQCTRENKDFTEPYDAAVRKVRAQHGAYDSIAHKVYAACGHNTAGVSYRRWFRNRTLPIEIATILVDITDDVHLSDFYPYLSAYYEI